MKTVTGINNLKDKWREAKLRSGDFRGLSNRFALAEKFGVTGLQVFFDSVAPKEGKIEIEASIYEDDRACGSAYTLSGLLEDIKGRTGVIEIQLVKLKWNKYGTDADRSDVGEAFIFKFK